MIYGKHPVEELLKVEIHHKKVKEIFMIHSLSKKIGNELKAKLSNCQIHIVTRKELNNLFPNINHQGVLIKLHSPKSTTNTRTVTTDNKSALKYQKKEKENLLLASFSCSKENWQDYIYRQMKIDEGGPLLLLDSIQDINNLASIIRTAESLGVKMLFITGKGASLNDNVHRVSMGASLHLPIINLANLNFIIKELKKMGFWICSSIDPEAKQKKEDLFKKQNLTKKSPPSPLALTHTQMDKLPPANKLALIIGNESNGIKKIIIEQSDYIISIPLFGKINSLNAGVAAAILIDRLIHK